MKKLAWISLIACGLSACHAPYASNDAKQYLESKNGPRLVIPKPLSSDNLSFFYTLPMIKGNVETTIIPPASE